MTLPYFRLVNEKNQELIHLSQPKYKHDVSHRIFYEFHQLNLVVHCHCLLTWSTERRAQPNRVKAHNWTHAVPMRSYWCAKNAEAFVATAGYIVICLDICFVLQYIILYQYMHTWGSHYRFEDKVAQNATGLVWLPRLSVYIVCTYVLNWEYNWVIVCAHRHRARPFKGLAFSLAQALPPWRRVTGCCH